MKRLFLLLLLLVSSYSSELVINNSRAYIEDKPYIIRCIEGYKWIQFVYFSGRGFNYITDGNPQQMFHTWDNKSLPIECYK